MASCSDSTELTAGRQRTMASCSVSCMTNSSTHAHARADTAPAVLSPLESIRLGEGRSRPVACGCCACGPDVLHANQGQSLSYSDKAVIFAKITLHSFSGAKITKKNFLTRVESVINDDESL
eukprot:517854-Prymnesium_polylepis.1